jgi:AmmeMemoRadiSam system protein B/AmmeMemoRadiSam system protein A
LIIIILAFSESNHEMAEPEIAKRVREPAFAGTWYPGTANELNNTVQEYFDNVKKLELNGTIKAIIVPHAGIEYSGQAAAAAFRQLEDQDYKTVIIIGPSHTDYFSGALISNFTHYKTPLGLVNVSDKAKELLNEDLFQLNPKAEQDEHDIEIELPFLQETLNNFEILPIIIGASTSQEELRQIALTLNKYVDDATLIVVSSDFTHYGNSYGYVPFTNNISDNLKALDFGAISKISDIDPDGFIDYYEKTGVTICGRMPIAILLYMLDNSHTQPQILYYDTSGRMTGDFSTSVSYVAMAFTGKQSELTNKEQAFLLKLARDTLETYLKTGKKPEVDKSELTPALEKVQGCFTTLNKFNNLRGCVGHILPQEELYKCVMDNAINAAVHDIRFNPVQYAELKDIDIEISVLTIPQPLEFTSGDDLLNKLRPMIDGVVLKRGFHQSTYLPQVWEDLPDKKVFLESLCRKGGMAEDCWQDTSTEVYTYQAFVFDE